MDKNLTYTQVSIFNFFKSCCLRKKTFLVYFMLIKLNLEHYNLSKRFIQPAVILKLGKAMFGKIRIG
jgi:hypothetical protein